MISRSSMWKWGLAALAAVGVWSLNASTAQTSGIPTPPVSAPGPDAPWTEFNDNYRLRVSPLAGNPNRPVQLELYSPDINLNDYAPARDLTQNFYGDEIYGRGLQVSTSFTLFNTDKSAKLAEKSYGTSNTHRFDELYQGVLAPGTYPIQALTQGKGKNGFGFRVSRGSAVEASQFTFVRRGRFNQDQVIARFNLGADWVGKPFKIENYDADGSREVQLAAIRPGNRRAALTPSGNTQWAANDFTITQQDVGEWVIVVRILPTTVQFSNSIGFRFPIFVEIPQVPGDPPQGTINVNAVVRSCAVDTPITANFNYQSGGPQTSQTPAQLVVLPGSYTLTPAAIAGATTQPVTVQVANGQTASATLVYQTTPSIRLEPANFALEPGESGEGRVVISSDFPQPIPFRLALTAPNGVTLETAGALEGRVSAGNPVEIPFTVSAAGSVSGQVRASLQPGDCAVAAAPITVTARPALTIEKSVEPTEAQPGDTVAYTITVTNTGNVPLNEVRLVDPLARGISGNPVDERFSLQPGENWVVTREATVTADAPDSILNTATATAEGGLRVTDDATVTVNRTPGLTLEKRVAPETAQPGDRVIYTLVVTNTGNVRLDPVTLSDPLAEGLQGQPVNERFALEPGQSRTFTREAVVTEAAPESVVNTAAATTDQGVNAIDTATLTVTRPPAAPPEEPNIQLTKTVSPENARPGTRVTYTFVVTNTGNVRLDPVTLSDPLAEGLQGQPVNERFALEPGQSRTFTREVVVTDNAPDAVVNTAAALTDQGVNAISTATVTVTRPAPARLELTRTPLTPNPAIPGETTRVCLQVRNVGETAGDYLLTDNPTDLLSPVQAPGFAGNLAPAQTREHCYDARTTPGPNAKANLNAVLTSPVQPNLTAQTPFERVNLLLRKTTDTPVVRPGREARFAIVVTNPLNRPVVADLRGTTELRLTPDENQRLTLQPGENRLNVTARPEREGTYPNTVRVFVNDTPATEPSTATVTVRGLPPRERETEVTLATRLASTPTSGVVVLSDLIPEGSQYVMGSSRLQRKARTAAETLDPAVINTPNRAAASVPLADPLVSGNRVYWTVPGPLLDEYLLSYRVSHRDAIQLPPDRVGVLLQLPQSRSAGAPRTPNGQAVLGSLGDLRLLSGDLSVLERFLSAVPIGGIPGSVVRRADLAEAPVGELVVYPLGPLTTERADQNTLAVVVRDPNGRPANVPYVTLAVTPEPLTPDAAPDLPGYQVAIRDGQGTVRLSSLNQSGITGLGQFAPGSPDRVTVIATAGDQRFEDSFDVTAAERPFTAVGAFSIQANLNFGATSPFTLQSSLNAFGRGSLGDALFTGAVNTGAGLDGSGFAFSSRTLRLSEENPYFRFPLTGDGGLQGTYSNSSDSVFLRLELDQNYLQYGQMNAGFSGLLSGYGAGYNGLKGVVNSEGFDLNAFAALAPNANRLVALPADGTSVYRLGASNLVPGSEQVVLVVSNRDNPNLTVSRQLFNRSDYRVDYVAGVVELFRPLPRFDLNGNPQSLEVAFAVGDPAQTLRAGVQADLGSDSFGVRATVLSLNGNNLSLAADQSNLVGFGLRLGTGGLKAEAELLSNLSNLGLASGAANLGLDTDNFDLSLAYQDIAPNFLDPRAFTGVQTGGRDLAARAAFRLGAVTLSANYSLSQAYDAARRAENRYSLEGRLGSPGELSFFAGVGGGFGLDATRQTNGLSASNLYGSLGLEVPLGNLTFGIRQRIGTPNATDLTLDLALNRHFGLRLQNSLYYLSSGIYNQGLLGVRGGFSNSELIRTLLGNTPEAADPEARDLGSTNITATYELPNLSGDAGRTRVGLDTSIPLSSALSVNLGGTAVLGDPAGNSLSGNVGLRLESGTDLRASANAEVATRAGTPGLKTVIGLRGAFRLSETFILSPAADYTRDFGGQDGARLSLAAAIRANQLSILTQNILRGGFYNNFGGTLFEGEVRAGYQADERFYLRAGAATRLSGLGLPSGSSAAFQIGAGFTWYLTDVFGLGANASYLTSAGIGELGLGLEGSLRVADGLIFSAGFNFLGTNGTIGSFQSQPGLYLRLDWLFDERLFGFR
ncbi:MAG: hypothetical protein SFU83_19330 [Meiothermus sp.]|nr:hypothetical protein [Meiothermus sp.]